ncbi:gliding motility-associated ABC transporter ATP-binding subunit GldA [Mesonia sp. HuA40]|uniref:gliding motility-associated ABC transporter ATP-binding subunit GldA n=1 Tax=Mesonia sp. HuA40 TaxID=2602761 RepID=UPI0011CA37B5|nr:gliding motility-associated ABC transporter ATP-binding subunit GldA [Mesonia sp. HuA40]TXK73717.1 gliding motility-associated ABC transporter ATP-binding subunit GldA [Mesonia sp. HuA40]
MGILVKNLSKFYGQQQALQEISFEIKSGEVIGFLGPNGAGKSTMMKILTGYLKPSSGSAFVEGIDVQANPIEVQALTGYLPEHNPLYEDMYIREYLLFHARIHKCSKQRIQEVIELTGLQPEIGKKIQALSKGYRQRVGIATALLHDPKVLILDEPTTGLDPNQLVEIRNLIKSISTDKTIFLSTHIMQEVEAMCSRVLIMNKGELIIDKPLSDLQQEKNQIIQVVFDQGISEEKFAHLPHLISSEPIDARSYRLKFDTETDMGGEIYDLSQANNCKILSLTKEQESLEDYFRKITSH